MHVHFIGIGGIGMSALARYFKHSGAVVSGSDEGDSTTLDELAAEGIIIHKKHDAELITNDLYQVVYSEAIEKENPERIAARSFGIPEKSYFAALGDISRVKKTIAICGTHGKSTTTAMTGLALEAASKDPLVILGTKVFEWHKKNIRLPQSNTLCLPPNEQLFVVESCEYHNSFLNLKPAIIVITNIEPDHLDFFGSAEAYYDAFLNFVKSLPHDGIVIGDLSQPKIAEITSEIDATVIDSNQYISEVPQLKIPGTHYRQNSANVLALANNIDCDTYIIKESLREFNGTWRRFEFKGEINGIQVFDDYAHHPTEIIATLKSFREKHPTKKIIAVFQPHQYSRTHQLFDEFANSFHNADLVLIPNIYRVRDTDADVAAVTPEKLVDAINAVSNNAKHTKDFSSTLTHLQQIASKGDIIVTMGAGPVHKIGEDYLVSTD
jgi:UDP-N-acetylmuramate--alanine ligase